MRRATKLANLEVGDKVWIKVNKEDKGRSGIVLKKAEEPSSYWVKSQGRDLRGTGNI